MNSLHYFVIYIIGQQVNQGVQDHTPHHDDADIDRAQNQNVEAVLVIGLGQKGDLNLGHVTGPRRNLDIDLGITHLDIGVEDLGKVVLNFKI